MSLVFRDKLMLIIIGCALLPLLMASLFWYWQMRDMVSRQVEKDLLVAARDVTERAERAVGGTIEDLGDFAGQLVFQDVLINDVDGEIAQRLTRYAVGHGLIQDLFVVNARGTVIAAIDSDLKGRSLTGNEAVRFLLRDRPHSALADRPRTPPVLAEMDRDGRPALYAYFQPVAKDGIGDGRTMVIGVQIVADFDSNLVIGALVGVMDWRLLEKELLGIRMNRHAQGERFKILLSDASGGQVMFDSLHALGLGRQSPGYPRREGVAKTTLGESRVLVGTARARQRTSHRLDWLGHAVIDRSLALAEVTALKESILLAGLAILTVTLLLAHVLARRFARPIEAVTLAMRKVAAGETLRPLKDSRADEIGDMISSFDDMAAQRLKTEQALVRAMVEAEKANRAKSDFLAMMSHEIRTPLNGVLGMAQILRQSELSPTDRKRVETIQSSGYMLEAIINDLLDMRELEQGSLELHDSTFDLCLMISGLVSMFRESAVGKGLMLRAGPMPGERCLFRGDAARVRQILWNLIGNAIKFTERGEVIIACEAIPTPEGMDTGGRERVLRLVVRDSGIGMDADKLRRVFIPFVQVDTSSTRRFGGTGLGLSIVKRLVDLMGGDIQVDSQPGEGTTFTLLLPLDPGDPAQLPGAMDDEEDDDVIAADSSQVGGLTVLVAEDNPVNLMIAKAFIERMGHTVLHAPDGARAVKMFEADRPDFIFMDIHMPHMDGVEATLHIRALEGDGEHVPIVALTADAVIEQHREFLAAGMNRVVTKPYKEGDLVRAIEELGRTHDRADCRG